MEKDTAYYLALLNEVAMYDYEDVTDTLLEEIDADADYLAAVLKEEIEIAELDAWLRHYTVDEYEKTREFIESNFADII